MGNLLRIVATAVEHLPAYLPPWQTNKNKQEKALTNANAENDKLQQLLVEKEKELETLRTDNNHLRTRNDKLQQLLVEKEKELETLRTDNNHLRTRLSEMGAMQLTEGNPNITDLSDQNRPDKIAKQFSELYDNQWRDCYQVLLDPPTKSEQETVETLLTILKATYDISLNRSQEFMSNARKVLLALAGKSDEEPEKALDSLIQETLHKMKSYRTKHFKAVPRDIAKEINEKLVETIGQHGVTACGEYIAECVRICWLMCIKDPPMYIFCEKEDVFNKNHFMEYTEIGHKVSYVVWPVLYLYKNGPLMRKGVAQGEGKQSEDSKVDSAEDWSPKSDDSVKKKPQLSTGTKEIVQPNEDDHQETKCSEINEYILESMPIRVTPDTVEDIYVPEHVSDQQVSTKDVNVTVAEGNSSAGHSDEDGDMNLTVAVDSDVQIQFQDVIRSQTENVILVESPLQGVIEIIGKENSLEGNAANVTEEEQPEQSELTSDIIESLETRNNGGEEKIHQHQEIRNQTEQHLVLGNIVSTDKEVDMSCRDKEAESKIAERDQAVENVKSLNTDVSNAIGLCNIESQGAMTSSPAEGVEQHVDESGKQEEVGIDMQLLTLTGHKAEAGQPVPDDICFIEEHGQDYEHELSNSCGSNSNNSPDSSNHGDDSTLEVEQKYLVQIGIANGEKIRQENGGKQDDAVMITHDNKMELGKKTNNIFLLENETRTVDHAMDMGAPHPLDERGKETEDDIVSPSNDKDRPEGYVKEENQGVGDVCSLSENIGSGEKADDYNRDLAVATDDGVARPTVAPHNEKHRQGNLSEDSSVEGQGEIKK